MMKILLVDDDAFLRDMYTTKFIECGYDVTPADTGAEALRLLGIDAYDLLIVDMVMPGMNGVELMQKARDAYPDSTMQCIVLSNQGQEQDIADAKQAGAIGYIIKAQSIPSEVVNKVKDIMAEYKK